MSVQFISNSPCRWLRVSLVISRLPISLHSSVFSLISSAFRPNPNQRVCLQIISSFFFLLFVPNLRQRKWFDDHRHSGFLFPIRPLFPFHMVDEKPSILTPIFMAVSSTMTAMETWHIHLGSLGTINHHRWWKKKNEFFFSGTKVVKGLRCLFCHLNNRH